jgi:MFS transporter, AAHS family, benzoate transport protein
LATNQRARLGGYSLTTLGVVAICFVTIVFDGYDLIVYGAVVPALLEYREWDLTTVEAGFIGSLALIGMLFGALIVGTITDIVGRRKIMLFCITWFSLAMGLCAIAPSPELLGLFRFIAGLGLGGVVPTAIALTIEYAPSHRRSFTNALMFSGYSVGGILAAFLAIPLLPAFGWRLMFAIGLAPLVLVVPLAYKFMPESISFLVANGRREEAETLARRYEIPLDQEAASPSSDEASTWKNKLGALFSRNYAVATALFWIATFIGLLLVYGLNTWLSKIMLDAGYPLGSALSFLLVLNLGAILGTPFAGAAADRFGSKPVIAVTFLTATACVALLSIELPLLIIYALVALAGLGSIGTTILVNAYTAKYYPADRRATALGWALGFGRLGAILGPLYGGYVIASVASQLGFEWNFYAFALPALLGVLVILLVPRSPVLEHEPSAAEARGRATTS